MSCDKGIEKTNAWKQAPILQMAVQNRVQLHDLPLPWRSHHGLMRAPCPVPLPCTAPPAAATWGLSGGLTDTSTLSKYEADIRHVHHWMTAVGQHQILASSHSLFGQLTVQVGKDDRCSDGMEAGVRCMPLPSPSMVPTHRHQQLVPAAGV